MKILAIFMAMAIPFLPETKEPKPEILPVVPVKVEVLPKNLIDS